MAVMLPGWVVDILNVLQFDWPKANEDVLFEWRDTWKNAKSDLDGVTNRLDPALSTLARANKGPASDALATFAASDSSNIQHVRKAGELAEVIGNGHHVAGLAVQGMKGAVVVQLGLIGVSAALSAGIAVFLFKELIKRALDYVIGEAVGKILGGGGE